MEVTPYRQKTRDYLKSQKTKRQKTVVKTVVKTVTLMDDTAKVIHESKKKRGPRREHGWVMLAGALKQMVDKIKASRGCKLCGYRRCTASLTWHHHDPTSKEGSPAEVAYKGGLQEAIDEMNKCTVLCANCHGEVHQNLVPCPEPDRATIDEISLFS